MKKRHKLAIAAAAMGIGFSTAGILPAQADFSRQYAPSYFTLNLQNANGSVNTSGAPGNITLSGGDNGSGSPGKTDYTTISPVDGPVSFDWNYLSPFDVASSNPFNFVVNNVATNIYADSTASSSSGTYNTTVTAGQKFGFEVAASNNGNLGASIKISNFSAPVPEPMSILGSLTAITFGANLCRTFKQQKKAKANPQSLEHF